MKLLDTLIAKNARALRKLALRSGTWPAHGDQYVQDWELYCRFLPPGQGISIVDLLTGEVHRRYSDTSLQLSLGAVHLDQVLLHENHQGWFEVLRQQLLLTLNTGNCTKREILSSVFTMYRSMRLQDGSFTRVKVTCKPMIEGTGDVVSRFVCWYIPLEPYSGQPITASLVSSSGGLLEKSFMQVYTHIYELLPFTRRERELIILIAKGLQKGQISVELRIAERTIEKYNQSILSKCRELFPLNSFHDAQSAVAYLKMAGIVEDQRK